MVKTRTKKLENLGSYTSKEALIKIAFFLCQSLPMKKFKFSFNALYNDDGEQHSPRRAWMHYGCIYVMKWKEGAWIFAYGEPAGKHYLFDGLEADLVAVRTKEWPITEDLLWKVFQHNPIIPTSNGDYFQLTLLASQNGKLVQRTGKKFELLPWSTETFARGAKFSPELLPPMREVENCFSVFLPDSVTLNSEVVRLIALKVMDFMLSN